MLFSVFWAVSHASTCLNAHLLPNGDVYAIKDCFFMNLESQNPGGAVSIIDMTKNVSFVNVAAENASSLGNGGAFFVNASFVSMYRVCARFCTSSLAGQMAHISGLTASISECSLRRCSPVALPESVDAVLFNSQGTTLDNLNSTFNDISSYGAGITLASTGLYKFIHVERCISRNVSRSGGIQVFFSIAQNIELEYLNLINSTQFFGEYGLIHNGNSATSSLIHLCAFLNSNYTLFTTSSGMAFMSDIFTDANIYGDTPRLTTGVHIITEATFHTFVFKSDNLIPCKLLDKTAAFTLSTSYFHYRFISLASLPLLINLA